MEKIVANRNFKGYVPLLIVGGTLLIIGGFLYWQTFRIFDLDSSFASLLLVFPFTALIFISITFMISGAVLIIVFSILVIFVRVHSPLRINNVGIILGKKTMIKFEEVANIYLTNNFGAKKSIIIQTVNGKKYNISYLSKPELAIEKLKYYLRVYYQKSIADCQGLIDNFQNSP